MLNFLVSLYNPDGTPIDAFAVFRLNADANLPVGSGNYRGYEFASADGGGSSTPQLQLTVAAVPEPSSLTLAGIGGAAIFGTIRRRQRRTA